MAVRRFVPLGILAAALGVSVFAAGCRQHQQQQTPPVQPAGQTGPANGTVSAQLVSTTPVSDLAPNEMGQVLVLEYHEIGPKEGRWERTPANFRNDLETLYKDGFRTVSMKDYVTGNINLPRGASPVLLTFDDSDEGQFRYIEQNGKPVIDPDCAVGILEEFNKKHPDFGMHASFYVLPVAFHQDQYRKMKFDYIVQHGMELGEHTWSHNEPVSLRHLTDEKVQEELARPLQMVQSIEPGYQFYSFALPNGIWPKNKTLAHQGSWNGISYNIQAVLLVGSNPAPSPYSKKFDPLKIPRVQAVDIDARDVPPAYRVTAQIKQLVDKKRQYVSDGDPKTVTVPAAREADVDQAKLQGKTLKTD